MYNELEELLHKYLDKDLLVLEGQSGKEDRADDHNYKPVLLVISESADRLNELKDMIGDRYKGVYVRDEEKACKYLEKHEVDMILREGASVKTD